jgi:hypothetical protein
MRGNSHVPFLGELGLATAPAYPRVYQIVGAGMEVCNQLGCGFLEAVYQEALEIECKSKEFISVYSRAFAVDYRRGDYKGLGARMF